MNRARKKDDRLEERRRLAQALSDQRWTAEREASVLIHLARCDDELVALRALETLVDRLWTGQSPPARTRPPAIRRTN